MDFAFLYETDQSKIFRIMVRQRNRCLSGRGLTHHDPKDLGLICLVKKRKIHFRILSDFRIQSCIFLKKRTLNNRHCGLEFKTTAAATIPNNGSCCSSICFGFSYPYRLGTD